MRQRALRDPLIIGRIWMHLSLHLRPHLMFVGGSFHGLLFPVGSLSGGEPLALPRKPRLSA